jgi:hypothetical protein
MPAHGRCCARLGLGGRRCRRATFATRRLGPRSRRRVCLALCHLSLRAVTAHHAPSLPRPRNRLGASGVGGLTRPSFGGRSGNANSNAPERAQVQSDLASRRRNQAPSGDPFARDCLNGQQFDGSRRFRVSLGRETRLSAKLWPAVSADKNPLPRGRPETRFVDCVVSAGEGASARDA